MNGRSSDHKSIKFMKQVISDLTPKILLVVKNIPHPKHANQVWYLMPYFKIPCGLLLGAICAAMTLFWVAAYAGVFGESYWLQASGFFLIFGYGALTIGLPAVFFVQTKQEKALEMSVARWRNKKTIRVPNPKIIDTADIELNKIKPQIKRGIGMYGWTMTWKFERKGSTTRNISFSNGQTNVINDSKNWVEGEIVFSRKLGLDGKPVVLSSTTNTIHPLRANNSNNSRGLPTKLESGGLTKEKIEKDGLDYPELPGDEAKYAKPTGHQAIPYRPDVEPYHDEELPEINDIKVD